MMMIFFSSKKKLHFNLYNTIHYVRCMYVLHSTTYVCNMKRHSIAAELMKNSYIIVVIQRGARKLRPKVINLNSKILNIFYLT